MRNGRRAGLLLVVVALVAACGSPRQEAESTDHTHEDAVNTVVSDALPNADLAELMTASDLVVSGQVVAVVDGVQIGSGPDTGHSIVTLVVDEIVKGDAGTKSVDVAMLTRVHGVPVVLEGRPTPKVGDRGIWMLQPIAPEFGRKGHILTNQNSQILAREGGLTAGLASSPSGREVKRLGDLNRVLEHLRAAAA